MGEELWRTDFRYLSNLAGTLLGQIGGVNLDGFEADPEARRTPYKFPKEFYEIYGHDIFDRVSNFSVATRGRIAAAGPSVEQAMGKGIYSHWHLRHNADLSLGIEGDCLLSILATQVVAARMAHIVRCQLRERAAEEAGDGGQLVELLREDIPEHLRAPLGQNSLRR